MIKINAVQLVKNNVAKDNIKSLLELFGAKHIQDMGDSFRSTCPLHHGDNPMAFTWNYTNGLWFCFTKCGTGGDIYDFIANIYDFSIEHEFKIIVKKTAEILNINIEGLEYGERTGQNAKELRQWIEFVSKKTKVINQPYDLSKLGEKRELKNYRNFAKETVDYFKSYYSPDFNRIVVPLFDIESNTIGATLRRLDEQEQSKWLHRPKHLNTRYILYNMNNIIKDNINTCILVEGAFDVWNLYQIGIPIAVGALGAHLSDEQIELIERHFTDVLIAFDNDKAGRNAVRKAINRLKHTTNLRILCYEDKISDPGEIKDLDIFNKLPKLKWYEWIEKYGTEGEK